MKPVILTFTSYYLPGYRGGGPIRSIANMVERLSDDFDFRIVTTDRDLGDGQPYHDVEVDAWNDVGRAKVFYASKATCTLSGFIRLMRDTPYDLLYLNSFFDPRFTLIPMFVRWLGLVPKRPVVVAPRGQFSEGALGIKSLKKNAFIHLARASGLFNGAFWHASTEMEASDIQRAHPVSAARMRVPHFVTVAPDLLQKNDHSCAEPPANDEVSRHELRVCFLSRIVPMKNLEYALRILAQVRASVSFNIFGPTEDMEYWGKCETLMKALPGNVNARYCGNVDHAEVNRVISEHDLFFVPSRGENFGHVFMEALAVGVPILVSDQTPWRQLGGHGVGWDIPLDQPEQFVDAIEEAAKFNAERRRQIRLNCLDFARRQADDLTTVERNRALFSQALASLKGRIERPIFIIGAARSGTTMLAETILSRHPDIAYLSEPNPTWGFGNAYKPHDVLTESDVTQRGANHIRKVFEKFLISSGKRRFMEKTPRNCLRMPYIRKIFPDAKFVHVIRDGRDVAVSASIEWRGRPGDALDGRELRELPKLSRLAKTVRRGLAKVMMGASPFEYPLYAFRFYELVRRQLFNSDTVPWGVMIPGLKSIRSSHSLLATCAIQWDYCTSKARSAGLAMPRHQYIEVRYEELIQNPQKVMADLCGFLELQINDEILNGLVVDVRATSAKEKWRAKLNDGEIMEIENEISALLLSLGYPLSMCGDKEVASSKDT